MFATNNYYTTMANSTNNKFHPKVTLLSLIFLLLHLSFPLVANSYNPIYNLAINCGSSKDNTLTNRKWFSDNDNTKLFTIIEPKITKNISFTSPPNSILETQIPYKTARISLSNFTYSFPITITNNTPVFLRLHFNPTSYNNFEPENANFSVKVNNNLTLLENFNPSPYGNTITKEYCIQIKPSDITLNITFIPNNINQKNYAFINGIEVVSMPSFLYYTNQDDLDYHLKFVGLENKFFSIQNNTALEMVYRVNVGEVSIPPSEDTGMFRNWDYDSLYLKKVYPRSVSTGFGLHVNYDNNKIPNYIAPEEVYLSARSYGMDVTEDYNVTWNFEVDLGFYYMVRLHFCEFDGHIQNEGDRVFQIFIADMLAEENADVIRWSDGNLVPVHKDYAVSVMNHFIGSSKSGKVNISIKLQRVPKDVYTIYRDVTLNGIEIFKISDETNSLAGSNPEPIIDSPQKQVLPIQSSKKLTMVIIGVVSICCLMLASVVGIIISVRRGRKRRDESNLEMEEIVGYSIMSC